MLDIEVSHSLRTDNDLWDLYHGRDGDYIASIDCEEGYLYMGVGRGVGPLAICRGSAAQGLISFDYLHQEWGVDELRNEPHWDNGGTWFPVLKLDKVPKQKDADSTMLWLLNQEVELIEARLAWLESMPASMRSHRDYEYMLSSEKEKLEETKRRAENGLCKTPAPTFRQMVEAKRQAQKQIQHI